MHAPQRMLPRSVRVASVAQGCEQSLKCGFTPRVQHALLGANAEYDFLDAAKGSRLRTETGAGELQSAPAERDLCRGQYGNFAVRQNCGDRGDRLAFPQ